MIYARGFLPCRVRPTRAPTRPAVLSAPATVSQWLGPVAKPVAPPPPPNGLSYGVGGRSAFVSLESLSQHPLQPPHAPAAARKAFLTALNPGECLVNDCLLPPFFRIIRPFVRRETSEPHRNNPPDRSEPLRTTPSPHRRTVGDDSSKPVSASRTKR